MEQQPLRHQRLAEVVAERGQETGVRFGRLFGGFLGGAQVRLEPLAVGDIEENTNGPISRKRSRGIENLLAPCDIHHREGRPIAMSLDKSLCLIVESRQIARLQGGRGRKTLERLKVGLQLSIDRGYERPGDRRVAPFELGPSIGDHCQRHIEREAEDGDRGGSGNPPAEMG